MPRKRKGVSRSRLHLNIDSNLKYFAQYYAKVNKTTLTQAITRGLLLLRKDYEARI